MKQNYLKLLIALVYLTITTEAIASEMTSRSSGNWTNNNTWNSIVINGTTYQQPDSNIDVIVIEVGHTVTINSDVFFSGVLIVKGTLIFEQNTGNNNGTLTMDADSKIHIRNGGEITSIGSGNSHGQNNYIMIGASSINGKQIQDNLGSPDYIDGSTLRDGGGCQFMDLCTPILLPIELLYFKANTQSQGIQIEWASAKEWNFSHYTVERSEDGKNFYPIHEAYGNGDSYTTKTYAYLDMQPNFGANYYRLKATDIDATVEYKGMALAYSGIKGDLQLYPNPAKGGLLTIKNPGAIEGTWLSIHGMTGQELMRIQMPEQEVRLPATALPQGVYIVKVWNHLEVKQARLVIQ